MEKKMNIRANLSVTKNFDVYKVLKEIQREYIRGNTSRAELAQLFTNGELQDVLDDNIEAFWRKTSLKLTDDEKGRSISKLEVTDFCVEDMCIFISDIVDAMYGVSQEYSELFAVLALAGFDYGTDGYSLPHLLYVDKMEIYDTSSSGDMHVSVDSLLAAAKVLTDTERTDKVMIACKPEDKNIIEVLQDRYFLTVGNTGVMIFLFSTGDVECSNIDPRVFSIIG